MLAEASDMFVAYLLARNIGYEEELVDQPGLEEPSAVDRIRNPENGLSMKP
jgi:hypothetical protein